MPTPPPAPRPDAAPVPTRRRGRALEEAIYQAVFDQLLEVGYAGLTMDGVANAARTGKAPLYRRWADKEALILDALRDRMPSAAEVVRTGVLRDDLLAVLRFFYSACKLTSDAALQIAKQNHDAAHEMMRERVSLPTRAMLLEVLQEAEARGDIRPGAATPLAARVGPSMVIYQNLTAPGELDDAFLVSVVDEVLLPMLRKDA
ncbi:TetR/AcrR family transcriptional regulator [Yinghuangia seranimata]|uniref:TetR/AcrR family transcriptional regulator n=1 Tax=Yinghuangia seranimata TaxID=408067 RepID=UPI00248BCCA2|nr:TetR/AcrR family transcriptional regulator [Yinghuangia seranimata]MDI2125715.1 TetR/AcrR family transcriptional regulator [Yinghuangia seranimata]